MYVLVVGKIQSEMQAFVADESIARFCTEVYTEANPSNFKKVRMHLTNSKINENGKSFIDVSTVDDLFKVN